MASQSIIVHIKPDDDDKPKIVEPSRSSVKVITPGPITLSIYNFCSKPKLWIQFQGFQFVSSKGFDSDTRLQAGPSINTTSNPMLFGSPMSFGGALNSAVPDMPPVPQNITTPPTFPTADEGSMWEYSILLMDIHGVVDNLDPIVVLSGDIPTDYS